MSNVFTYSAKIYGPYNSIVSRYKVDVIVHNPSYDFLGITFWTVTAKGADRKAKRVLARARRFENSLTNPKIVE